jgi:hypothetical protein
MALSLTRTRTSPGARLGRTGMLARRQAVTRAGSKTTAPADGRECSRPLSSPQAQVDVFDDRGGRSATVAMV